MQHKIDVVCYSGYRANERPLKFTYQNNEFKIKKILDRSMDETLSDGERVYRFKVLCTDNKTYSLIYNCDMDLWFLGTSFAAD
jgi:hypothetical protein